MSKVPGAEIAGLEPSVVTWQDKAVGTEIVPANEVRLAAIGKPEHLSPPESYDLNIATTYGLTWDIQKCGRDVWQNFFDANQGTLDGIQYRREEFIDEHGKTASRVIIFGEQTYDWRYLTLIGGTTKGIGQETAGGFGEGAKLLALALLRDHHFQKVEFGSQDWRLNLRIGDLDIGRTAEPMQGMFGDVSKSSMPFPGNYIMLESTDSANVDQVEEARLFFRSSENPDFNEPTLEVHDRTGRFGFKYLPPHSFGYTPPRGSLYVAGQRRHFDVRPVDGDWHTVTGLNLWTSRDISFGDRDRGAVDTFKVNRELLAPMVRASSQDETLGAITTMEPSWSYDRRSEIDVQLLGLYIGNYRGKLDFDPRYLAVDDREMAKSYSDQLHQAGYVLCLADLSKIGMRTLSDLIREMTNHREVEHTPEQQRQIEVLENAADFINRASNIGKRIVGGQVKLYSNAEEKTFFEGQYKKGVLWMAREVFRNGTFSRALSTYLHETDHRYGGDRSAEFSYALTSTLEMTIMASVEGGANDNLAKLAKEWYEAQEEDKLRNPEEPEPIRLEITGPGKLLELGDGHEAEADDRATATKRRNAFVRFVIKHFGSKS